MHSYSNLSPHNGDLLYWCFISCFRILDDVEVFEKHKAFEIEELLAIADFFNHLIYEAALLVPSRELNIISFLV